MTGTGAQTDPYIVSTWDDFKTAISIEGVHIQLGADIDMNEAAPTGISAITVNADTLDGKNYAIKNLVANNGFLDINETIDISNLKILNFVNRGTQNFIYMGNYKSIHFKHCVISGINEGTGFLIYTSGARYNSYAHFEPTTEGGSMLNINMCSGNFVRGNIDATDSYIKLSGKYHDTASKWQLNNCYIDGIISCEALTGCYNSVIDAECPENSTFSVDNCSNLLVNTDKFTGTFSTENGIKKVTAEQLTDAEYLESINFPIGVE